MVVPQPGKDVALVVDLAGVDLVEECHHDKGVEDDGEVFRGRGVQFLGRPNAIIDAKKFRA
jgi:hypothetical protein